MIICFLLGGKVADGGGGGGVKSKGLAPTAGQLQLADMLERQSLDTPSQPSNPALSSTQSMFSSVPDSATSSSVSMAGFFCGAHTVGPVYNRDEVCGIFFFFFFFQVQPYNRK